MAEEDSLCRRRRLGFRKLLLPAAGKYRALEIKAGATVNADYFRGLAQFAKAHGGQMEGGCVVYGGEQNQRRSDWPVWSWRTLFERPG